MSKGNAESFPRTKDLGRPFVAVTGRGTFTGTVGAILDRGSDGGVVIVPANVDASAWGGGFNMSQVIFP